MGLKPYTEADEKRDREIARKKWLLEPGVYDFEVTMAEDTTSKKGNPMIALTLRVFGPDSAVVVRDWLLESGGFAFKTRHFARACGVIDDYEEGQLDANRCQGLTGRVQIIVEDRDEWGHQNRVRDYGTPTEKKSAKKEKHPDAVGGSFSQKAMQEFGAKNTGDDIPF